MGTRNLTVVILNDTVKVAQYGQWDGYPEGQGTNILKFLKEKDLNLFKEKLSKVRFLDPEGIDREFIENYDKNCPKWSNESDNRTEEEKNLFEYLWSRDIASDILYNIYSLDFKEFLLRDSIEFSGDSLFCEWAYVVDLDKNVFEVYKGFSKEPVPESNRFFKYTSKESDYYPVSLIKEYFLDNLPSEENFLNDFKFKESKE